MTYYPIPQPTIANNILVRRERRLPVPGEVLVKARQRVEPSDTVACTTLKSEAVQVDISGDLGLSPSATAKRLLVRAGGCVRKWLGLAERGATGSRVCRS